MVIISPQLGMAPTATTGGETYDREVLKQLVKLGQEVRILLPKGKEIPAKVKGWQVDRTPVSHFIPPYTFNIFAIPWVFQKLQVTSDKRQVLRIHSPEYLFPTAYLVKKFMPQIPVVAHYHLDQTGKLWTMMNKRLLNTADAVIADSEYLKERLINRVGVKREKIYVIHCGVDVDAIKPRNHKPACRQGRSEIINHKSKTLLFLGRFIKRKRPELVVEVFAKLHKKYPETRLVMIGEGPMLRKLKIKSEKLKISDTVEFPGPLFGEKKLQYYHDADLFIFPSEHEGFVLVVLEAMAAGLPLLVPRSLGFPEAVEDGENGLLAETENIDDWVEKAERILYDEKLRVKMRRRSRQLAETKFSWERCARKCLGVYSTI